MDVSKWVEFDENLKIVKAEDALRARVGLRISCPLGRIPYYPRGLAEEIFTINYTGADIRAAIRDIVPNAAVIVDKGRISVNSIPVFIDN